MTDQKFGPRFGGPSFSAEKGALVEVQRLKPFLHHPVTLLFWYSVRVMGFKKLWDRLFDWIMSLDEEWDKMMADAGREGRDCKDVREDD